MYSIIYCQQWFRRYKKIVNPMSAEEAERLHNAGLSYAALLGPEDAPRAYVQMLLDKKVLLVGFLDAHCREYLSYQFEFMGGSRIFLSLATFRKYSVESESVIYGETYSFSVSGEAAILETDFSTNESRELSKEYDASSHFIEMPDFGDFESLAREEWL